MPTLSRSFMGVDRSIPEDKIEAFTKAVFKDTESEFPKFDELFKNLVSYLGVDVHLQTGPRASEIVTIITTDWTSLYAAFTNYQDPSNVLFAIRKMAREAGESIREKIKKSSHLKGAQIKSMVTTGKLTQLIGIYRKVEWGELSHGEAQDEVVRMFESAGETIGKEFKKQLQTLFRSIAVKPGSRPPRKSSTTTPPPKPKFNHGCIMERDPGEKEPRSRFW